MEERISVRQWQDKFLAGDFEDKRHSTQCAAGWYDWFCKTESLAGRLKKIGSVVMGITDPFILDNYYVWFKNNCPLNGPLYDDVRFEPLTGERDGKYFVVSLDSPHERQKWSLITERYGYDAPEFDCANVREMSTYINKMGKDLEQGILPAFIAEKNAVVVYFSDPANGKAARDIYRNGNHIYSWQDPSSRQWKNALVVSRLEDAPSSMTLEGMVKIGDLYILPLADGDRLPQPKAPQPKRKQQQR